MRTLGKTSAGTARTIVDKSDRARLPKGIITESNDDGARRCRCHFLTDTIPPIAPTHIAWGNNKEYEIVTQENYEYLRDSYLRYAELSGVRPELTSGQSVGESINNVFNAMLHLLGESQNLNIEENEGRLYFNIWAYHVWGRYVVYYFPTKFMESLNPGLRKIVMTFFCKFMRSNGISTIEYDYDLEVMLDWIQNDDGYDVIEAEKRRSLVKSYSTGKAIRLLEKVGKKSYFKNLGKAIARYKPVNEFEQSLVSVMSEGLEFINPDKGIMQYAYDPFYDEDCDYPPIPLSRQIRVVYDIDDEVTDGLLDYLNCEQRETYEITPVECMLVSPETDCLFAMKDDYPERFFKWTEKFIDLISR